MECGRSSSLSVEDGNRRGSAFGRQEVLYSPLAPQRDDRRMLKQQKHTRMRTPYYPFLYLSLNLVCRQVGSYAEVESREGGVGLSSIHGYSRSEGYTWACGCSSQRMESDELGRQGVGADGML